MRLKEVFKKNYGAVVTIRETQREIQRERERERERERDEERERERERDEEREREEQIEYMLQMKSLTNPIERMNSLIDLLTQLGQSIQSDLT